MISTAQTNASGRADIRPNQRVNTWYMFPELDRLFHHTKRRTISIALMAPTSTPAASTTNN